MKEKACTAMSDDEVVASYGPPRSLFALQVEIPSNDIVDNGGLKRVLNDVLLDMN